MTHPDSSRREFLTGAIAGPLAFTAMGRRVLGATRQEAAGIPTRPLGRAEARVSILSLGGWHIGTVSDPAEAIRIMHAAIDHGVTFFDNAWDYHDGGSEEIMGRALAQDGKRERVFLMTKNCERDYEGSMRNLDESLRRLRTDHLDLWQFHEMVYDNAPDWVFEQGGIRAAEEARRAGKVRYIGFTGHKDPRIHLKMLAKDFAWDTSQMPVNVMDAHYRSFQAEVIPVCLEQGVSVIGMKSLGGGFPRAMIPEGTPLTAQDCLRYALSQPIASLVAGMVSMDDLEQAVAVARDFRPLDEAETAALLEKARPLAGDGRFERFKSTQAFDGPHHRRQHGFA
jgi:aryl-alcohol dehydrogenase-like predicted oxidoreductase